MLTESKHFATLYKHVIGMSMLENKVDRAIRRLSTQLVQQVQLPRHAEAGNTSNNYHNTFCTCNAKFQLPTRLLSKGSFHETEALQLYGKIKRLTPPELK